MKSIWFEEMKCKDGDKKKVLNPEKLEQLPIDGGNLHLSKLAKFKDMPHA